MPSPLSSHPKVLRHLPFSVFHAFTQYIEDYLPFEVNTKYISSSVVKKSIFHECVAQVKMLIFSPHVMKYMQYIYRKKCIISFYFILQ